MDELHSMFSFNDNKSEVHKVFKQKLQQEKELIEAIKANEEQIRPLYEKATSDYCIDRIYRYYHHSFKVYHLQDITEEIFQLLVDLTPAGGRMNGNFLTIAHEGMNHKFEKVDNLRWNLKARPILEAYFRATHILNMIIRYGLDANDKERSGNPRVVYGFVYLQFALTLPR